MKLLQIILFFLILSNIAHAQQKLVFDVVPLGIKGGSDESNLSAYAIAVKGTKDMVCLDAGTIYAGIKAGVKSGAFTGLTEEIIRNNIKGYLISHPHLDHVSGLIMNSPEDSKKNIYGMSPCLNVIKEKYFSWKNWANFTDDGESPRLNKYHYVTLDSGKEVQLENTLMQVTAYPLSHGNPYQSTAFLIHYQDHYLLYLGDTGADEIEKSTRLKELWSAISTLIKAGKLTAIFIEVSFPNEQAETKLFGHLTPGLLMKEMSSLQKFSGTLDGVSIVITHRKPSGDNEEKIRTQLVKSNSLSLKLVFPEQGKRLSF